MPPRNITAALLGLLVAAVLAIAIYLGAWRGGSEGPGYLAVIDTCGILTIRSDDSHWRFTCLQGIYAAVSVSGDGKTIDMIVSAISFHDLQIPIKPSDVA